MRKTIYFECASGISGDMTVAALLDLGASREKLTRALNSLNLGKLNWSISETAKDGFRATRFKVETATDDHHRHLSDIERIIGNADLEPDAAKLAKKIFRTIAAAEAGVHGTTIAAVHFHEVGALDSIADVVGTAVCFTDLAPDEVVIIGISEGSGVIESAHGKLSVPVPAVANIAAAHALPLINTNEVGEMITPTGAAIAATLRTRHELPKSYIIKRIGMGAGTRTFKRPNILRAMMLEEETPADGEVWVLEANMDDCTGEQLGLAMEKLFAAGARDVSYAPVFMKKSRPGWLLTVIGDDSTREKLEEVIFCNTTTIGLRRHKCERTVLKREIVKVILPFGEVEVKVSRFNGSAFCRPEYESVRRLAAESGVDFTEIYNAATVGAEKAL